MQAVIDRFEKDLAVLRIPAPGGSASGGAGGQELNIPKKELPQDAKEGSALFLIFSKSTSEEAHREKLAKSILNEILNAES